MRTIQAGNKEPLKFSAKETNILKKALPYTSSPSLSSAKLIMPSAFQLD